MKNKEIQDGYGRAATEASSGCCATHTSKKFGYTKDDICGAPQESNMGLSCGNPTAVADLQVGEVVLDLGSGGGFDCFLAAKQVGATGKVIGVDITPEMIDTANKNAQTAQAINVEFRLGDIAHLPVSDGSVDVVISNCVINLCEDKESVFKHIKRVLKKGGRFALSDTVIVGTLSEREVNKLGSLKHVYNRFITAEQYQRLLSNTGFKESQIVVTGSSCFSPNSNDPISKMLYERLGDDWDSSKRFSSVLATGRI